VTTRSDRAYPHRPIVGVGAVIVTDGGVVLVKRRFEPLAGRWSLPGGGVELGETLAQAIAREVLEETSLEVTVGPVIEVVERIHRDPDGRIVYHYVLVDFLCRRTGGALLAASDAGEVAVAGLDGLSEYRIAESTRAVIEKGLAMARDEDVVTPPSP
jgi:mutator protein MutT